MKFNKILIPTDFSETSINAANFALEMAKPINGEIYLFHANIVPDSDPFTPAFAYHQVGNVEMEYQKMVGEQIEKINSDLSSRSEGKVSVNNMIEVGNPVTLMMERAEQNAIDLIIVGMAASEEEEEFYSRSNILKIINMATVPILIVPHKFVYKKVNKIVHASDEAEEDIEPISTVAQWAEASDAELTILHVVQENDNSKAYEEEFLKKIRKEIPTSKIKMETVDNEDVTEGLIAYAELNNVDLITIHKQRHNFIERIFGESVTKKLAYKTAIPLLIFQD